MNTIAYLRASSSLGKEVTADVRCDTSLAVEGYLWTLFVDHVSWPIRVDLAKSDLVFILWVLLRGIIHAWF